MDLPELNTINKSTKDHLDDHLQRQGRAIDRELGEGSTELARRYLRLIRRTRHPVTPGPYTAEILNRLVTKAVQAKTHREPFIFARAAVQAHTRHYPTHRWFYTVWGDSIKDSL